MVTPWCSFAYQDFPKSSKLSKLHSEPRLEGLKLSMLTVLPIMYLLDSTGGIAVLEN